MQWMHDLQPCRSTTGRAAELSAAMVAMVVAVATLAVSMPVMPVPHTRIARGNYGSRHWRRRWGNRPAWPLSHRRATQTQAAAERHQPNESSHTSTLSFLLQKTGEPRTVDAAFRLLQCVSLPRFNTIRYWRVSKKFGRALQQMTAEMVYSEGMLRSDSVRPVLARAEPFASPFVASAWFARLPLQRLCLTMLVKKKRYWVVDGGFSRVMKPLSGVSKLQNERRSCLPR